MPDLGKYAFASKARELLAERGVEKVFAAQLEPAKQRVIDSVQRASAKDFVAPVPPSPENAVTSYALARLLLSLVDSEYYWQKFGRGEALLAMRYLSAESEEAVLGVAADFFPAVKASGEGFQVPLLEYAAALPVPPQAQVEGGVVFLSKPALFEALRNAIARRARERPASKPQGELFKQAADELLELLPKPLAQSDFKGSYLSLPCIQAILSGVEEGRRYYASMALATACRKDGLPREKGLELMNAFVQNCRKQTHPFTLREAQATLDWVYRRQSVSFNCNSIRSHGLAPPECAFPCTHDKSVGRGRK